MAAYPHLFFPLKVGAHFLKNRIVMAPVETGLEKQDFLDERVVSFYEKRAKGEGPGLFIIGNGIVHLTGAKHLQDPVLTSGLINNASRLTSVLHQHGSKVILQLQHYGAEADHPFAISATGFHNRNTGRVLHKAPGLLVRHLINQYALCAYHAVMHGDFDGIEINGGGLSLPNTFSNKLFNHRHDKWGRPDRTLFATEIVRRVRSFIGPSPILAYRISLMDLHPDGNQWHDLLAFAQTLKYEGVNLFSFDLGLSPNTIPVNSDLTPQGVWVPFMEKFSQEIKVPVIFGHRMPGPERLEHIIKNNITSLVELGRPLVADPRWVEHVRANVPVNPCVSCSGGCMAEDTQIGRTILTCVANPTALRAPVLPSEPSTVLVVGGGPAGLAAAREAAQSGHQTTLIEENPELGGLYRLCAKIPGRNTILDLIEKQEQELIELGVEIIKNQRATPEWIEDHHSRSRIILATGKESAMPDIPGIDNPNVLTVEDLLQERMPVGHRVAVIANGNIGVDIARYLCTRDIQDHEEWYCAWGIGDPAKHVGGTLGVVPHLAPATRQVYLISQSEENIDELFARQGRLYELQWLRMHGSNIFDRSKVEQIDNYSVRVLCQGEESSTILRVDHIVTASEREARDELSKSLSELGLAAVTVGSLNSGTAFFNANESALDAVNVVRSFIKGKRKRFI